VITVLFHSQLLQQPGQFQPEFLQYAHSLSAEAGVVVAAVVIGCTQGVVVVAMLLIVLQQLSQQVLL
jgi:hypothetical protein